MKNRGVKGSFLAPRLFCFFLKIFRRRDFVCRIAPPHGKNIRERRKKQVVFNPREERRAVSERGNGSLRSDGGDVQTLDGKRGVGVAVHYGVQTCGQGVEHRQRQIEHAARGEVDNGGAIEATVIGEGGRIVDCQGLCRAGLRDRRTVVSHHRQDVHRAVGVD